jgi:hypothetical protein
VLSAVLSPTADAMLKKKFWDKDGFLSQKGNAVMTASPVTSSHL